MRREGGDTTKLEPWNVVEPPPSPLPSFVRELLEGDHLERAEEALGLATGTTDEEPARQERIASLSWDTTAALRTASVVGGSNDPTKNTSDGPWLVLIAHLLGRDPAAAGRAARAWYGALMTAGSETDDPVPHRALAAYVAGVVESYAGNDIVAEQMLETGHAESELDEDVWTPLFGACRFVRAAKPRK